MKKISMKSKKGMGIIFLLILLGFVAASCGKQAVIIDNNPEVNVNQDIIIIMPTNPPVPSAPPQTTTVPPPSLNEVGQQIVEQVTSGSFNWVVIIIFGIIGLILLIAGIAQFVDFLYDTPGPYVLLGLSIICFVVMYFAGISPGL
ncbi:MAG: hypothetical protein FWE82_03380 [Defluviitaleaceae bacterium]|nr:hypothetical protein [Defluviitaleaceae bacterium]